MKSKRFFCAIIIFIILICFASKLYAEIVQITDNYYNDIQPSLYNNYVAWSSGTQSGTDTPSVNYWNGSTTETISENNTNDWFISQYNGTIAWNSGTDSDSEIYYWNGAMITRISENQIRDFDPSIFDETIAWSGGGGTESEIYYWDGGSTEYAAQTGTSGTLGASDSSGDDICFINSLCPK